MIGSPISKNFFSAYLKGRVAFKEKGEDVLCPYSDHMAGLYNQVITYSRAFRYRWYEGFEDEKNKLPNRYHGVTGFGIR